MDKDKIEEMIRVNHAGEYGAKQIYAGQLSVLKDTEVADVIKHMADQELEHLEYFSNEITERRIRPSLLMPFWHVSGFMLGKITAKISKEAAMACTVAVEEVIDEHYQEQLDELPESERPLKDKIKKFQEDELEHRDTGIEHNAYDAKGYAALTQAIKLGSRIAIELAKKI